MTVARRAVHWHPCHHGTSASCTSDAGVEPPWMGFTRHIHVARPTGSLRLCKSAILPICFGVSWKLLFRSGPANEAT